MTWSEPVCGEPLDGFIRGLHDAQGLDLTMYDELFLRKAVARQVRGSGLGTLAAYGAQVMEQRAAAEALNHSLHIAYSEFFRNPLTFALLEERILPGLLAAKKQAGRGELRIWSVACAAGQEAWSVAMLMDELTRAEDPPQAYRIFASDLSESEVAVARAGVYSAEAVANVRLRHLEGCFSRQGESFVIAPRLRERVDFSTYDLLDPDTSSPTASIYGDFDLILCCNLLFYYRPVIQRRILDKLCRALVPGGYCVTGEAEREIVARQEGLRVVIPPATVFQRALTSCSDGDGPLSHNKLTMNEGGLG